MTHAEREKRLRAITPALHGMSNIEAISLLLAMLEGVANCSGDPESAWTYIAAVVEQRTVAFNGGADDCRGHA